MVILIKTYWKFIHNKVYRALKCLRNLTTQQHFILNQLLKIQLDFSKNLNINLKIKKNTRKLTLKETLKNYIPEKYVDRLKMGFSIPLDEWMKGPLKNWVSNSLNMKKIKNDGYLDEKVINEYMHEHFEGKKNWSQIL